MSNDIGGVWVGKLWAKASYMYTSATSMRSTSSRPMLRSIAGAAMSVGQSVTTSFPDCLVENPYCSKMLAAACAAVALENEIRMVSFQNRLLAQILPAGQALPTVELMTRN